MEAQDNDDLTTYAQGLGVEQEDADLHWLVQEAFHATLPLSWSEHTDDEGRLYFFREASQESSWEHPMDAVYRELVSLVKQARNTESMYAPDASQSSIASRAALIHAHLRQVHQRALEALEGWSGPYASTEGEYYYNEALKVSVWESPLLEWNHEIVLRHDVLCRCLLPEHSTVGADGSVERLSPMRVSGAELLQHLQLNLELVKRGETDGNPQSPATSRDYLTARSGASTTRSQISSGDRARAAASSGTAGGAAAASGHGAAAAASSASGGPAAAAAALGDAAVGGSKRAAPKKPPPPQELIEKVTIYTRPEAAAAGS